MIENFEAHEGVDDCSTPIKPVYSQFYFDFLEIEVFAVMLFEPN